jgi:hypothetical protein
MGQPSLTNNQVCREIQCLNVITLERIYERILASKCRHEVVADVTLSIVNLNEMAPYKTVHRKCVCQTTMPFVYPHVAQDNPKKASSGESVGRFELGTVPKTRQAPVGRGCADRDLPRLLAWGDRNNYRYGTISLLLLAARRRIRSYAFQITIGDHSPSGRPLTRSPSLADSRSAAATTAAISTQRLRHFPSCARKLVETDINAVEKQLDAAGTPPMPGRLREWQK